MWPASVSTITTSISPPPTTTGTTITPYRPFEELGFPSPEPPAPPVGELSPPLPGSQWTLSPPAEEQQRASIETVRSYSFANGMRGCVSLFRTQIVAFRRESRKYIWMLSYGKFYWGQGTSKNEIRRFFWDAMTGPVSFAFLIIAKNYILATCSYRQSYNKAILWISNPISSTRMR